MLPLPDFPRLLDVPCGSGRHMRALAEAGYAVHGADNDPVIIAEARRAGLDAVVADMRDLEALPGDFDGVVCMWASFGYFGAEENRDVLRQLAKRVRPRGRIVLDVYDRLFVEAHQGERENRGVIERKQVRGGRLRTELRYPDGFRDRFEWQLYSVEELEALGRSVGARPVLAAVGFDEDVKPRGREPRMQVVLER